MKKNVFMMPINSSLIMEIKILKKLVSILLAVVLVFGVAATGFAAAPEEAVLEEVTADAAVAPEEEAPVIDEEPVAEVAAVEEEPVADAQVTTDVVTYTVETDTDADGVPGAELKLQLSGNALPLGAEVWASNGTNRVQVTTTPKAFPVKTDKDGKVVVTYELLTAATQTTGTNIEVGVSAGTSPLVYAAVAPATPIVITNDAFPGATGTETISLAETTAEVGYNGIISGTVKDAAGKAMPSNTQLKITSGTYVSNVLVGANGAYSFSMAGTANFMGAYTIAPVNSSIYTLTSGASVTVDTTSPATITNDIVFGRQNTVTVTSNKVPIANATVISTAKGETSQTDANGVAVFIGLADAATTFKVAGGMIGGTRYYGNVTGSVTPASNTFTGQSLSLTKAPSLSDLVVSVPANVSGAVGLTTNMTATVTAPGFTAAEFTASTNLDYQWEYYDTSVSPAAWTEVTTQCTGDSDGATLTTAALEDSTGSNAYAKNGAQFRVKVTVKDAGYNETYAVTNADFKASSATTLNVAAGATISGRLFSSVDGPVNTDSSNAVKLYTPEEYAKKTPTAIESVDSSATGAFAFTTKVIPGNYVVEVIETPSGTFWSAGGVFKQYTKKAVNVTVTSADAALTIPNKAIGDISMTAKPAYTITSQPISQYVAAGTSTDFTVAGTVGWGSNDTTAATPAYAWKQSTDGGTTWTAAEGTNNVATYTVANPTAAMSGYKYKVEVTVGGVMVTSSVATLKINPGVASAILSDPSDISVIVNRQTAFYAVYTLGTTAGASDVATWEWSADGETWNTISNNAVYTVSTDTIDGITTSTLTLNQGNVPVTMNNNLYRLNIKTSAAAPVVASKTAKLTVTSDVAPLSITAQPQDTTAVTGAAPKFSISVGGTLPFQAALFTDSGTNGATWTANGRWEDPNMPGSYWSYFNTVKISATTLAGTAKAGWQYQIRITDMDGRTTTSNNVKLTAVTDPVKATIVTNPSDLSVTDDRTAMFKAVVAGSAPYTYQWQVCEADKDPAVEGNWNDATSDPTYPDAPASGTSEDAEIIYAFDANKTDDDGNYYRLEVASLEATDVYTTAAMLTVTDVVAPSIVTQPSSILAAVGTTATFDVVAGGSGPFTYQWFVKSAEAKDFTAIPGAVGQSYTTPVLADGDNMTQYKVVVTSMEDDFAESMPATLTVSDPIASATITGPDSLYIGDKAEFDIMIDPAGAEYVSDFYIADSNKEKAEITGDGMLTAKAHGILKVYAELTGADGQRIVISKKIAIKKATTSFGLKSKENRVVLYKGGDGSSKYPWHTQLILTNVKPSGASSSVKDMDWRSSNPKIATVVNGKVKVASGAGTKLGTVIITATDKGNPNSIATYILKVTKA